MNRKTVIVVLSGMLAFGAWAGSSVTWKGGGTTTAWSDGTNWEGGTAPVSGDSVVIPADAIATARQGDLTLVNSLAGIEIKTGGKMVVTEVTASFNWNVPLSGGGSFAATNFNYTVNMYADNTAFTGPFNFDKIRNCTAWSSKVFGTTNSVTLKAYTSDSWYLSTTSGCVFSNDFTLVSGSRSLFANGETKFYGPVTVGNYCMVGGYTKYFYGGFQHTGSWTAYLSETTYFEGDEPIGGEQTQYGTDGGPLYIKPGYTAYLGAPFQAAYGYNFMVDGTLKCTKANRFSPINGVRFGGDAQKNGYAGTFNIGGYDQTISNLNTKTDYAHVNTTVTSPTDATLTILGGMNRTYKGNLTGAVSLDLNSTTSASITLAGADSTTKGGLIARRGTITVDAAANFPNLTSLEAKGAGNIVLNAPVGTNAVLNVAVATGGKITIAQDVTLKIRNLTTNGVYVAATSFDASDPAWSEFFAGAGSVEVEASPVTPSAPNANTLAFYTFDTVKVGASVVNRAGDDFTGEITAGTKTVTSEADRPGRYIFESGKMGAACIAYEPRSIHFDGAGEKCSFPGLATAISSNDDYTVEFFWKLDDDDAGVNTWTPMLTFNIGTSHTPDKNSSLTEGPMQLLLQNDYRWYCYTCSCTSQRAYFDYGSSSAKAAPDGLWHHMAIVYYKSAHKYCLYGDYEMKYSEQGTSTNKVQIESLPLTLGHGVFKGHISCLRVSNKAFGVGGFLHASDQTAPFPETVFHWTMDGAAGTVPDVIANTNAVDLADWYPDQYFYQSVCTNAGTGRGTVTSFTESDETWPAYTTAIPRKSRPTVMSGLNPLWQNLGSLSMGVKTRTSEQYMVDGSCVKALYNEYLPVRGGSFTMEGFYKFDFAGWKERIVDTQANYKKFGIMGLAHKTKYAEFSLIGWYASDSKIYLNLMGREGAAAWSGFNQFYYATDANFFKDNRWHHIAIVYDDDALEMRVYFDKQVIMTQTFTSPFTPNGDFASRNYQVGYGFNACAYQGLVDEVRLVRKALTTDEFLNFNGPATQGTVLFVK